MIGAIMGCFNYYSSSSTLEHIYIYFRLSQSVLFVSAHFLPAWWWEIFFFFLLFSVGLFLRTQFLALIIIPWILRPQILNASSPEMCSVFRMGQHGTVLWRDRARNENYQQTDARWFDYLISRDTENSVKRI